MQMYRDMRLVDARFGSRKRHGGWERWTGGKKEPLHCQKPPWRKWSLLRYATAASSTTIAAPRPLAPPMTFFPFPLSSLPLPSFSLAS